MEEPAAMPGSLVGVRRDSHWPSWSGISWAAYP